jgi:glycerol kinase
MPLVLALDQSTSATKALLFDADGRCLDTESRGHRQHYPQPGWVEHDAEEIWANTLATLRAVAARHESRQDEIACLSLANQRETVVVFARGSGRPLRPAIVWLCRRGDALCDEHRANGMEPLIHSRTGLKLDAYFSASKLQWLVRNDAALRAKLARGEALVGTIDAWLVYRLTGGRTFATDSTNASRTLLFDITRMRWDDGLCDLWQVPRDALPEVRESSAVFGETTLDGALRRPLPVCGVMGDSQAALFAQRCFEPGMAKATFGTGSSVLLNIGREPRFSRQGIVTTLAWVIEGRPTYALEGIIISAAATLSWLSSQLGLMADAAESEAIAASLPGNEGVYLVPAFSGLGFPHWQPAARAAITGLSGRSDRRHVVRAGLESIAYQIRDVLDGLRADAGVELRGLRCDGGPTSNRWLMQFTADLAGVELRASTMPYCSALGAAFMGMLGRKIHSSETALGNLPCDDVSYSPSMPPDDAQRLLAGWWHAVRQTFPRPQSPLPAL